MLSAYKIIGISASAAAIIYLSYLTLLPKMIKSQEIGVDQTDLLRPSEYVWGHAINSRKQLMDTLDDHKINAIEADIIFSEKQQAAVMGHPPMKDGDITLNDFLKELKERRFQSFESKTIVKLDFKSSEAFYPSIQLVQDYIKETNFSQGVFINADILRGPCRSSLGKPNFDAVEFLKAATTIKNAVLSIGWTTCGDVKGKYSMNMIKEMQEVLRPYPNVSVTYPIRATSFKNSWNDLKHLYDNPNHGITLWWSFYTLSEEEFSWIFNTLENSKKFRNRTYYDIKGFHEFFHQINKESNQSYVRNEFPKPT